MMHGALPQGASSRGVAGMLLNAVMTSPTIGSNTFFDLIHWASKWLHHSDIQLLEGVNASC